MIDTSAQAGGDEPSGGPGQGLAVAAILLGAASVALLWRFTADDAFIVHRYARNALAGMGVVFNAGERVSALTSPLHFCVALALAALHLDIETAYKVVSVALASSSLLWLSRQLAVSARSRATFLALTLASPTLVLWTVGGLETPLLLAAVSVIVGLTWSGKSLSRPRQAALFMAATAAFLARFDAVLLVGPCIAAVLVRHRRSGTTWVLAAGAAAVSLAWLAFSHAYFGDVLPTSFYVKARALPSRYSVLYAISFLVMSGVLLPVVARGVGGWAGTRAVLSYRPVLALGLGLHLLYATINGTTHMMFGYRMFVPALPVLAALAVAVREHAPGGSRSWVDAVCALMLDGVLAVAVAWVTVNPTLMHVVGAFGDVPSFEYGHEGAHAYARTFVPAMRANAADVARDWKQRPEAASRPPRVATYAAGVLPWELPNAYVLEQLVSFRHRCEVDRRKVADYFTVIWPREGPLEAQLDGVPGARLVGHAAIVFDGEAQNFDVFFNPRPIANPLPGRVDQPCAPSMR
jgi:arabinofuranosyltransferase